ncbi:MAG: response regulator [Chromatiales bacterium]|jgi:DNA-binding response OmpR family regulator
MSESEQPTIEESTVGQVVEGEGLSPDGDPLKQIRHDFRTSVVHILGYSELLEEEVQERGLEGFIPDLRKIQASGKHLLDVIAELRVASAEDAQRLDLQRLHYELRNGLDQVEGFSEILAEQAEDQGHMELLADLEKIRGAAELLLHRSESSLDAALLAAFDEPPAPPSAQASAAGAAAAPGHVPARSELAQGGRLLVIDDDPGNREILGRRLASQGFEVELAADGSAGLEAARGGGFDLILLDIMMPGLDGYDVLRELKQDARLRHTPVIVLSALDEVDSVVQCLLLGADDYLAKPFNPILLRTRVGACLEKHRLRKKLARRIRVFVSSPGDVQEERRVAQRVIDGLALELGTQVSLEPFFWEAEPLLATDSFQTQILTPADAEIFVCILWSKLGTRLPPDITRPDGSRYDSGTQYEFECAVAGHRANGYPKILVYRKTAEPQVSLSDKDQLLYRLEQKEALDRFVKQWFEAPEDQGFVAAFHGFAEVSELEERLAIHLRKLIRKELAGAV